MDYLIYIGAALAIGLLIGFVALSVVWLRKTMLRNIRSHTLDLISVYDELLEKKSRELASAQRELAVHDAQQAEKVQSSQSVQAAEESAVDSGILLAAAERAAAASYRDSAVGQTYRIIRQNFSYDVEELLPVLAKRSPAGKGPATGLLEQLQYDTVYQLSTLPEEQQLQVLQESLPAEGKALLESYLQAHPVFSALSFYDNLKSLAAAEPQMARLYVPADAVPNIRNSGNVEILPDADICEGFQAVVGGKLYDYCIKTKELS